MSPILQGKMGGGSWKEEDIHWLSVMYQIHWWYYCIRFSKSCYTTVILSPIFKVIKLRVRCPIGNLATTARRWKDRNKIQFFCDQSWWCSSHILHPAPSWIWVFSVFMESSVVKTRQLMQRLSHTSSSETCFALAPRSILSAEWWLQTLLLSLGSNCSNQCMMVPCGFCDSGKRLV